MIYWVNGIKYDDITRIEMGKTLLIMKLHAMGFRNSKKGIRSMLNMFEVKEDHEVKAISNLIVNHFDIKHNTEHHDINSKHKQRLRFSVYKHLKNKL